MISLVLHLTEEKIASNIIFNQVNKLLYQFAFKTPVAKNMYTMF